jgi:hypothetical protein
LIAFLAAATIGVLPPGPVRIVAMENTHHVCCVISDSPSFWGATASLRCESASLGDYIEMPMQGSGLCAHFVSCIAVGEDAQLSPWTDWAYRMQHLNESE